MTNWLQLTNSCLLAPPSLHVTKQPLFMSSSITPMLLCAKILISGLSGEFMRRVAGGFSRWR